MRTVFVLGIPSLELGTEYIIPSFIVEISGSPARRQLVPGGRQAAYCTIRHRRPRIHHQTRLLPSVVVFPARSCAFDIRILLDFPIGPFSCQALLTHPMASPRSLQSFNCISTDNNNDNHQNYAHCCCCSCLEQDELSLAHRRHPGAHRLEPEPAGSRPRSDHPSGPQRYLQRP